MKIKNTIWAAIFLFILNYWLLWVYSKPIPYNSKILYLPIYNQIFFYFYLAVSIISCLLIIVWIIYGLDKFKKNYQKILVALLPLFLIFLCVIVLYSWIPFGLVVYKHIDTLEFDDKFYQLAVMYQYDNWDIILLGECEQTQIICQFSPIFFSSSFSSRFEDPSNMELSTKRNQITISWSGETIFIDDENSPICFDAYDVLYCLEPYE